MTSQERREALANIIKKEEPTMTGISIMYRGERRTFDAYKIPLRYLVYNQYNGRIGSAVKSYEKQHHPLDPDNPDDVKIIEKFLTESSDKANKRTRQSLLEEQQQKYGIVTADGQIIDGNRRACLLNSIWRDEKLPLSTRQKAEYFIAVILPENAEKKEIMRLETTYQMGEDAKVDYGPIEKYLKARDLSEVGFTNKEIATFMGVTEKEVKDYLRTLKLMDEYLEVYNYSGIYTALDTREDSFLKLTSALDSYAAGNVTKMWDYHTKYDVSDLKLIAFDYIRLGLEQTAFRDIIRKPGKLSPDASIFANKEIWQEFSTRHLDYIQSLDEQPLEERIRNNPNEDLSRHIRARDDAWRAKVKPELEDNFNTAIEKLKNRQIAAEPSKLVAKALDALNSVDTSIPSFVNDQSVRTYLENIKKKLSDFDRILNQ